MKPRVNKAQRKTYFPYGIYSYLDAKGYIRFHAVKNVAEIRKKHTILQEFTKLNEAKNYLKSLAKRFDLCEKLMDIAETEGSCFYHQIGQCQGACIGLELPDSYNERAKDLAERLKTTFEEDFFIIEKGKADDEKAVVLVQNGHFQGYGYINTEGVTTEDFFEAIKKMKPTTDSNRIIRQYLSAGKGFKVFKI